MNDQKNKEKSRESRPWARPRDLIIVGILAVFALALLLLPSLLNSSDEVEALIYHNGEIIDRFILEEGTVRVLNYEQLPAVEIKQWEDQSISFIRSDCPDQVCVNTGKIRVGGQFAACLPNNFVIVLESRLESEGVDAVA